MRIVLTGGPARARPSSPRPSRRATQRFVLVPEAATQVYDALRTRWDRLDLEGRRDVQRRIYRLQVEQEDRLAAEHPDKMLLLDRGTIDGAAYWPEGPDDYWRDLGTTLAPSSRATTGSSGCRRAAARRGVRRRRVQRLPLRGRRGPMRSGGHPQELLGRASEELESSSSRPPPTSRRRSMRWSRCWCNSSRATPPAPCPRDNRGGSRARRRFRTR